MFRRLLFFLLLLLTAAVPVQAASPYGRFHALVIGIESYQHLIHLKTPVADAKAVAKVLKKQYGFTVKLVLNPDRDQLMKAVSDLRRTMTGEKDSLLIYYAGHGFLDKMTGVDYWQPVNAQRHSDLYWIPTSRITDTLRAIRAKHILVVADSCYSGSLLRGSGAQLASGMRLDEWLRRMFERRSRTALTSGGEEPVLDSGGSGHSVFSWVFLEVLRNNRDILDGESLFDRIKRPVVLKADQTPQYGDIRKAGQTVELGDFLFVPKELQQNVLVGRVERRRKNSFARRGNIATIPSYPTIKQPIYKAPVTRQPNYKERATRQPVYNVTRPASYKPPVVFPKQGDTMTDPITGMKFVYVPKGCFQMGSPPDEKEREDDEGPVHKVCVDGFWMGKYEVTQGQWQKIMSENPFNKGDDYPVEQVSWDDAQQFIGKLNERFGKKYRLPTEAEWEYACRANGSGKYCGGDNLDTLAWYDENSGNSTHPVGKKQANAFGLYDMSGNVWEWCADRYGEEYYASSPKDNPIGPASGTPRVIRGGSYFLNSLYCRSVIRGRHPPGERSGFIGFRLVLPFQSAGR